MKNLRIKHAVCGPFRGDQVVPASAVPGGAAECERWVEVGAAAWTDEPANVETDDDTKEIPPKK